MDSFVTIISVAGQLLDHLRNHVNRFLKRLSIKDKERSGCCKEFGMLLVAPKESA